jgi:protein-disulfide isomerase
MSLMRLPLLVVCLAALASGCKDSSASAQSSSGRAAGTAADPVVAEAGGRRILLSEVDARWQEFDAAERARVTQMMYQSRRNMIDLLVGDALIAEAAKAANLSVDDYSVRELGKASLPVTDADIRQFYEENKDRAQGRSMDELRPAIEAFLQSQRTQQARAKLVDALRSKSAAGVKVMLEPPRVSVDVAAGDPAEGPADAPITIVEFSDYQCPFCARVTPTMDRVMKTYAGKVRRVFKDFPLPSHPQAPKAAEAARCAGDQGKYWEMHARLFANQAALQIDQIKKTASSLGIDQAAFDQCLDGGKYTSKVSADVDQGEGLGVNSTPSLFINGRPLVGAQPFDVFKQVIDEELARVGSK